MSHEGLIWELYSYTYIAGVNHAYSNSTNFDGHFSNENVSEPFRTKRVRNSNHNMCFVLFLRCICLCKLSTTSQQIPYQPQCDKTYRYVTNRHCDIFWFTYIVIWGLFSKNCSDGCHTLGNIWHVFEVDISTCLLIER